MTNARAVGLYGFGVTGVRPGDVGALDAPAAWPKLHVAVQRGDGKRPTGAPLVDAARAVVSMGGGRHWLVADRASDRVVFHGPPLEPAELVHPYLSPAAAIFSRWHGREVFHGGAFVGADGAAVAVLGRRDAGKSTLLAALAARGVPILSDDLVVVDDGRVFAGPRTIDLRAEPGPNLTGNGSLPVARARSGTRWRLEVPAAEAVVPLGGWVFLTSSGETGPGSEPEIRPVQAPLGLSRLARGRGYPELATNPKVMLDLAALPSIELSIPRSWEALAQAAALLSGRP